MAFSPLASLVTSRRQNPGIEDVFVKDRGIGNPWLWEVLGCYSCYCGFGIKITSHFFCPEIETLTLWNAFAVLRL